MMISSTKVWFLLIFSFQLTTCALSETIQNFELDDILTLPSQIPNVIDKIKTTIRRFQCSKGWKRVGGSCYHIPNRTDTLFDANLTCRNLHIDDSNLIQVRSGVQLVYAAHVLIKNNFPSLIVTIDRHLIKGANVSQMLIMDQDRWKRMKQQVIRLRAKYRNSTRNIANILNATGIRVSRRSRKLVQSSGDYQLNDTDEYEYDDFDSSDEIDPFEQIEDLRSICDDIHWNVLNETLNSTAFILTKYSVFNKTMCSLTDIDAQTKYHYLCEYVLDFCFANILCGKRGRCKNTLSGFKCSCSFLYDGIFCDTMSFDGKQILVCVAIILGLCLPFSWLLKNIIDLFRSCGTPKKPNKTCAEKCHHRSKPLIILINDIWSFLNFLLSDANSKSFDYRRSILLSILTIINLSILYTMFAVLYWRFFDVYPNENSPFDFHSISKYIFENRLGHIMFAGVAAVLIIIFSFSMQGRKLCGIFCWNGFRFPPPMNPFQKQNRFATAVTFGILAFEVLQILEELFLSFFQPSNYGILIDLCMKMTTILVVGLEYYPIFASLNLQNLLSRFIVCLYITCLIVFIIMNEVFRMNQLQLLRDIEQKLDQEIFIGGCIKNIPHFISLSYITAELYVRFAYDSIWLTWKTPRENSEISEDKSHDWLILKKYVTKLLRKKSTKRKQSCLETRIHITPQWKEKFRFTTMVISTNTVAFVFLYYLTYTFISQYLIYLAWPIRFIKSYVQSSTKTELETVSFRGEIIFSGICTAIIHVIHLLLAMGKFHYDQQKIYKKERGQKFLKKNRFKSNLIASDSTHYSGSLIGHMAWGFVICFHMILLICIVVRLVYQQAPDTVPVLNILTPLVVAYMLRNAFVKHLAHIFLTNRHKEKNKTKKYKSGDPFSYSIFAYFMFFADCLLGTASSIFRLPLAFMTIVFYMARLDYSLLVPSLKHYDSGYNAYQSYLRMELEYTNPIIIAFCTICLQAIHKRPQIYLDEDRFTSNNDASRRKRSHESQSERQRTNTIDQSVEAVNQNTLDSYSPETSQHPRQNDSLTDRRFKNNATCHTNQPIISTQEQHLQSTNNSSHMPKTASKVKFQSQEDQSDDEDGSLKSKVIPQKQRSSPRTSTASSNADFIDDDDDGGIRLERRQNAKEKHQQKKKSRKDDSKKKEPTNTLEESADEDGAMLKSQKKIQENKPKKKSSFFQCFYQSESNDHLHSTQKKPPIQTEQTYLTSEDEDEDGGRTVRTYETIKNLFPSKRPTLKTSAEVSDDSESQMTISSVKSVDNQKTTSNETSYATITTDSSSDDVRRAFTNKIYFLRSKSYQKAQDSSPPIVLPRPKNFRSKRNRTHEIVEIGVQSLTSLINDSISKQNPRTRARTRWYLAYTLIRNPSLCQYRKKYLKKLRQEKKKQQNTPSATLKTQRSEANNRISTEGQSHHTTIPLSEETSTTEIVQQENIHSLSFSKQTSSSRDVQITHRNE